MKAWEALRELHAGKRVKRAGWRDGCYLTLSAGTLKNSKGESWMIDSLLRAYDDWEIYVEPGHDFLWAMHELERGTPAVKRRDWSCSITRDSVTRCVVWVEHATGVFLRPSDYLATDWVRA